MSNDEIKISLRAYAKTLGISDKAIRKAIETKKIVKGVTYKPGIRYGIEIAIPEIIKSIADIEYGYRHKPGMKRLRRKKGIIEPVNSLQQHLKSAEFAGCGLA